MNENKNSSKVKILIGVAIVVVIAVIFAAVYNNFGPKSSSGKTNDATVESNSENADNTSEDNDDTSAAANDDADSNEADTTADESGDENTITVTIEVIDDQEQSTVYEVTTDAEFLRQAMEESDMEFSGDESDYGMYVKTINGVSAIYEDDGAYWAFYVDGEYCNYGIDSQPLSDGQQYQIIYTK